MREFFNTCEQLSVCKTLCDMSKKGCHYKSLAPCFICEIKKRRPGRAVVVFCETKDAMFDHRY